MPLFQNRVQLFNNTTAVHYAVILNLEIFGHVLYKEMFFLTDAHIPDLLSTEEHQESHKLRTE